MEIPFTGQRSTQQIQPWLNVGKSSWRLLRWFIIFIVNFHCQPTSWMSATRSVRWRWSHEITPFTVKELYRRMWHPTKITRLPRLISLKTGSSAKICFTTRWILPDLLFATLSWEQGEYLISGEFVELMRAGLEIFWLLPCLYRHARILVFHREACVAGACICWSMITTALTYEDEKCTLPFKSWKRISYLSDSCWKVENFAWKRALYHFKKLRARIEG